MGGASNVDVNGGWHGNIDTWLDKVSDNGGKIDGGDRAHTKEFARVLRNAGEDKKAEFIEGLIKDDKFSSDDRADLLDRVVNYKSYVPDDNSYAARFEGDAKDNGGNVLVGETLKDWISKMKDNGGKMDVGDAHHTRELKNWLNEIKDYAENLPDSDPDKFAIEQGASKIPEILEKIDWAIEDGHFSKKDTEVLGELAEITGNRFGD